MHEPMIRQDRQARRLQREERHELVAGVRMALGVRDRRLVSVVAIGDDRLTGRHQVPHATHRRLFGQAPQAMMLPLEIARLGDRIADRRRGAPKLAARIGSQHEQQADIRGGRLEELHPVSLWPGGVRSCGATTPRRG
jgi:hypothetical protein